MDEWIWFGAVFALAGTGVALLFRSLRRWRHPPARSAEQVQAEMQLYAESRQTDRW